MKTKTFGNDMTGWGPWLCVVAILIAVVISGRVPAAAQNAAPGQPFIYLGPSSFMTDGLVVDAYAIEQPFGVNGAPDVCAGIALAYSHLPAGASGITIDARGYAGTQNCSSPALSGGPIPASANGRVLLGNATININGTWKIPAGLELVGLGALSTTIQTGSNFQGTTVIQMGNGPSQFGVKVKALTVNCGSTPSCIGVYNDISEEGSMVEDVIIDNASQYGLQIKLPDPNIPAPPTGSPFASNSGPYRNLVIQYPNTSTCSGSTIGVYITGQDGGQIIRGLDNVTINSCGGSTGISLQSASTRVSNSTISLSAGGTGIKMGNVSGGTTHNLEVDNVYFSGGAGMGILAAANASNIVATNISSAPGIATLLEDDGATVSGSSLALAGPYLGFYMRGECTVASGCLLSGAPALATSAPFTAGGVRIPWEAPEGRYCAPGTC
ncbi:MAG: right-handed parallel beta-helix repeat-containing protein [Acidobacteriales bacterium]|nr:right-handed parallel beta-helix repeat-containing protein [Terriglobales bacterium]